MPTEILEAVKQQVNALSHQERIELSHFLAEQLQQEEFDAAQGKETTQAEDRRREQMAWLKAHAETHGGQYVALVGSELVGVGRTFREAVEAARAVGRRDAFVTYLPKPDEVIEMEGIL